MKPFTKELIKLKEKPICLNKIVNNKAKTKPSQNTPMLVIQMCPIQTT